MSQLLILEPVNKLTAWINVHCTQLQWRYLVLFLQAGDQQLLFTEQGQRQFFLYAHLWAQIQYFLALKPGSVSQSCPTTIAQGKQSQEPQNPALRQQPDLHQETLSLLTRGKKLWRPLPPALRFPPGSGTSSYLVAWSIFSCTSPFRTGRATHNISLPSGLL